MDFSVLFGNEMTKSRLASAIRGGTLPHALLIVGPRGSGRKTLALQIAAALNCQCDTKRELPCSTCSACKRILSKGHPDVKFLTRDSGKATIGVDEVRLIKEDMYLSSTEAKKKIYIAEEADLMTPQAQNALLKVFEEPPNDVHIILICESTDLILTTIRSRAQQIHTELFKTKELECILASHYPEAARLTDEERRGVVLTSGGTIGKALDALDKTGLKDTKKNREIVLSLILAMNPRAKYASILTAFNSLPQKRDELRQVLETLLFAIRDIVVIGTEESTPMMFFINREEYDNHTSGITPKRGIKLQKIITEAISDIDKNTVIPTLLTDVSVRIYGIK